MGALLSPPRLLSIKIAALEYGISEWTLRDLIAVGELCVLRPPRLRRIWIDCRDLEHALTVWKERAQ
jgi:hypothetical protein